MTLRKGRGATDLLATAGAEHGERIGDPLGRQDLRVSFQPTRADLSTSQIGMRECGAEDLGREPDAGDDEPEIARRAFRRRASWESAEVCT
ncbi:MAG: hypothetical protein R2715_22825 [Ilumatobacteraceae bacterium]